jgi:endonuclease YncB( thermonuclease family)
MIRPPYGLCLPVERPFVHDGDTIAVVLRDGSHVWRIRLLDCWCPELHEPGGKEAKQYAEKIVSQSRELAVFIQPKPGSVNLLRDLFSFDRVLARIFVGDKDLSELMVQSGHANATKTE